MVYRRDASQKNGAESGQVSLRPDSMFGAQLDARLSERLEAVRCN
ncbi:MAG: hypothetical protein AB1340_10845 [Pseudomonadota bacterium]